MYFVSEYEIYLYEFLDQVEMLSYGEIFKNKKQKKTLLIL